MLQCIVMYYIYNVALNVWHVWHVWLRIYKRQNKVNRRRRRCRRWSMMKSTRRHLDLRKNNRNSDALLSSLCSWLVVFHTWVSRAWSVKRSSRSTRSIRTCEERRIDLPTNWRRYIIISNGLFQKFPPRSARRQPRGFLQRIDWIKHIYTHTHTHTYKIAALRINLYNTIWRFIFSRHCWPDISFTIFRFGGATFYFCIYDLQLLCGRIKFRKKKGKK